MEHVNTRAVHAGSKVPESSTSPKVAPIYATSVFSFDRLDLIDEVYLGEKPGYVYTRMRNPGYDMVEEAVASLEGVPHALVFSSGMAAITLGILAAVEAGDKVVSANVLYGGTHTFLKDELPRRGVQAVFVNINDLDEVRGAVSGGTKVLYCETISNPLMEVADLEALAEIAHSAGALLMVDNTFASPVHCRPASFGADVVIHSATKYLNGHSDVTMGALAAEDRSDLHKEYWSRLQSLLSLYGPVPSPIDSWLLLRGIRTLGVRMERHSQNALELAKFLEGHKNVERVFYPGLESSPYHNLGKKYLSSGFGGMLSFEVKGGLEGARRFVDALKMTELVPSLAGVATTVSHPAKTSHRSLTAQEKEACGVRDSLIRVSCGLEHFEDIRLDFSRALDQVK